MDKPKVLQYTDELLERADSFASTIDPEIINTVAVKRRASGGTAVMIGVEDEVFDILAEGQEEKIYRKSHAINFSHREMRWGGGVTIVEDCGQPIGFDVFSGESV